MFVNGASSIQSCWAEEVACRYCCRRPAKDSHGDTTCCVDRVLGNARRLCSAANLRASQRHGDQQHVIRQVVEMPTEVPAAPAAARRNAAGADRRRRYTGPAPRSGGCGGTKGEHAERMAVLRLESVSKSFPGVRALDRVGFEVRAGEVHALLGENGAGKSTLIKIMSGVYQPDGGSMLIDGKPVRFATAGRCPGGRHRDDLPGAAALPRAHRRREHLHGPRAAHALRRDRLARDAGRRPRAARLARHPRPRRRARRSARSRSATGSASRSPRRSRRTPAS